MDELRLFDPRPRCDRCLRPFDGPRWKVLDVEGNWRIVCPYCAHEYERKVQLPADG